MEGVEVLGVGGEMAIGRPRLRKRGDPREFVGFRCPNDLVALADSQGRDRTEGLIRMLDAYADAKNVLGENWREVEILALREQITEGEALGKLAAEGLKKSRR